MNALMGRFEPQVYAILRIVTGSMFMVHGTQKLFGAPPMPGGGKLLVTSFYGFGGLLELVFGAMVALGLFTSIAAFLSSGEMAVAYFIAHAHRGFLPLVNQGELAVLYCFVFLYMASRGSGIWSVESAMKRRA